LTVINEILDFSKLEAGEMQIEQINFNLTNTVEQTIDVLANTAYSKGIELSCRIEQSMPNNLQGDPTRLNQVLTNLIGNAIKFTQSGGVSIDVSAIATTDRQTTLYVQVQDTGIGIAPDSQDKIFQSFSQADSSTTRQYGGTGLGLAISKRSIEKMGGEIGVISAPGAGSIFWFTLTCARSSVAAETSQEAEHSYNLTQALRGKRLCRCRCRTLWGDREYDGDDDYCDEPPASSSRDGRTLRSARHRSDLPRQPADLFTRTDRALSRTSQAADLCHGGF
jgi:hypothetical protein